MGEPRSGTLAVGEPGSLVGTLKVRAKELTCVAWIHPHLFVSPHR